MTEEHTLLLGAVRDFTAHHITPHASAWDRAAALPPRLWKSLAELGLTGVTAPEELGGAGMDTLALALVVEAVARASGSVAWLLAVHGGAALPFAQAVGDGETAGLLARGERIGGFALLPDARARRDGEHWWIEGRAEAVTFDPVRGLLVGIVTTSVGPTAFRIEGESIRAHPMTTLGLAAAPIGTLELCGSARLLGQPGQAGGTIEALQRQANTTFAALSVGLGQGALDAARLYSTERRQFGKQIADFQAIQWMLADSGTELEAARLLTHRAAAGDEADALAARLVAAEAALAIADRAIQIHGGYGYTRDYPVERIWRDAQRLLVGTDAVKTALGRLISGG